MEPLGLITALLLGGAGGYGLALRSRSVVAAVVEVKTLQDRVRVLSLEAEQGKEMLPRLERLERWQSESSEHITLLVRDTLALGTELKGGLAALEAELNTTATAAEARLEALMQTMDEQLQGMQGFIVKAAEDAKVRRASVAPASPAVGGPAVVSAFVSGGQAELAELMERQQAAQQEFALRRRAQAAANFQAPSGAGL